MDETQQIRIDQYLSGELTAAERQRFEQDMAQDAALAQEVQLQRDIVAAFSEPEVEDLEAKLAQIVQAGRQESRATPWPSRRAWLLAASLLLLLGLGFLLWRNTTQPRTPKAMYMAHAEYPARLLSSSSLRALEPDTPAQADAFAAALTQIDQQYQRGAYATAQQQLDSLAGQYPRWREDQADTYFFWRGMLLLRQEQYKAAHEALAQVQTGPYAEAADWHRTLLRLRVEGPTPAVREALRRFTRYENPYRGEAEEMLGEVE